MAEGLWLYSLCKDAKAQRTMEIGCAYGFSTLYFLAALKSNHGSLHIAIDPHEHGTSWKGIGARNVQAVGMESSFRLLEEISALAIPRLIGEGLLFDLIFVDGNHRFDDVLIDFTLSALACKPGGYVILDDTWMPSVRKAVSFVRRNRVDFTELSGANPRAAAFQRTGNDQRDWDHYQSF